MQPTEPITAYIALGANLGDRVGNLRAAVDMLSVTVGVSVVRVSSNYENPAVGGPPDSPPFLNAAAELRTSLSAHALLARLLEIEARVGRVRRQKWEPRLIDLDLLLYGDQMLSGEDLVIPHPLMHERRFVLEPLAEIAPDAFHPVLGTTVKTLLENLAMIHNERNETRP